MYKKNIIQLLPKINAIETSLRRDKFNAPLYLIDCVILVTIFLKINRGGKEGKPTDLALIETFYAPAS